jgi:predicted DNA-binding ribbon-helix-helix protein
LEHEGSKAHDCYPKVFVGKFWQVFCCRHGTESDTSQAGILRDATMMKSSIVKRSIVIDGHKTSVSLEDEFWTTLKDIAHAECVAVSKIVADIDGKRKVGNLSSAVRLFVLDRTRAGGLPIPRASLRAFAGEGSEKSSAQTISSLAPDAM